MSRQLGAPPERPGHRYGALPVSWRRYRDASARFGFGVQGADKKKLDVCLIESSYFPLLPSCVLGCGHFPRHSATY
eukprot:9663141-Prorocentrum_lima.AAC.1